VRLDHDRCSFVGGMFLPHRVEGLISLLDEVSDKLRAEAEERELLDNLVDQFLELWRIESENREGRGK
jgi:hypothetical protein